MAVLLGPACAVLEQEARQRRVAAEHRVVERGRVPVAAAHRDRPAEFDHEPCALVGAFRCHLRQEPELLLAERFRQVGPPRTDAARLCGIAARACGDELLVLGDRLGAAALTQQLGNLIEPELQRQAIRADAARRPGGGIGARIQERRNVAARAPPPDRPQQRRAPVGDRRVARRARWDRRRGGAVARAPASCRSRARGRSALLPMTRAPCSSRRRVHASASGALHRMVERLVVVGIGAGLEQQFGQLRIMVLTGRAVERGQGVAVVGLAQRAGRPAAADALVGIGARREQ